MNPSPVKTCRPHPALLLVGAILLLVLGTLLIALRGAELRQAAGEAAELLLAGPATPGRIGPLPSRGVGGPFGALAMELPAGAAAARMISGTVRRGNTLASILSAHGLATSLLDSLLRDTAPVFNLERLSVGNSYGLWVKGGGELAGLHYQVDAEHYLLVDRTADEHYFARILDYPFQWEEVPVEGAVSWSFFGAADDAGLPSTAALHFVELFAWDVDFHRDLQPGDSFRVLLRQKRLLGSQERVGSAILAASFTTGGKTFQAFRFSPEGGSGGEFYDAEGRSLRKEFLKAPLSYTRVSSRYSRSRLHPVLGRRIPHWGVDYAAPSGTPVVSTADGTVTSAGWERGGGRTVRIRHGGSVTTGYLHLSRFGRGIRSGARVQQGQVIGYVGATGLATGPHLDYRVTVGGRYVDPLRLDFPSARHIPAAALPEFTRQRDERLSRFARESDPA